MLLKGQIKGYDGKKYLVRIPSFETPGDNQEYVTSAILAYSPGLYEGFVVGDIVIVGFENNHVGSPVILGKLYTGEEKLVHTNGHIASLQVNDRTILSEQFQVGQLTYEDLLNTKIATDIHEAKLQTLDEKTEVTAYNPTLNYSTESTIAKIGDVDIKVTMPAGGGGGDNYYPTAFS